MLNTIYTARTKQNKPGSLTTESTHPLWQSEESKKKGMEEEGGEAGCMSRAAMVTVIHVVDTLEPTQSLPPVAAIPRSVCLCRRPPCVPGRVTVQSATTKEEARHCYRKRRRTKALFTPPPTPTPPKHVSSSFNYICWGGLRDNTQVQSGQGTLKLFVFFFFAISFWRCLCLYANDLVSGALQRCAFTTCSGQSRLLISEWGHGKSHRFPFKLKIK